MQYNVGQTKIGEKKVYNGHNKAQEGESSMRRSTRLRNKVCGFKNDQNNDCKGKQRIMKKNTLETMSEAY